MRKLSFFWKTWLTMLAILIVSIVVCVASFIAVSQYIVYVENKETVASVKQKIIEIKDHIESEGIDDTYYWTIFSEGFLIQLANADGIIYPVVSNDSAVASIFTVVEASDAEKEGVSISYEAYGETIGSEEIIIQNQGATIQETLTAQYNGSDAELKVQALKAVHLAPNMTSMLQAIILYYAIGGLLVAMLGSWIYAKIFTKKMKHMGNLVEKMGSAEFVEIQEPKQGDELQKLENNLYAMYQRLQQTMKELDEEVTYTRKLEADKQLFMRGATHELKTPIMAASVMLEGMIEKVGAYEDTELYLRKCYQTLQSMNILVNEVLEVSKIEHVQFEGKTEIVPIIELTLEMYDPEIKDKELTVRTFWQKDKDIKMSEKTFRKVISNLIGNAIKFSEKDSEILVQVTDKAIIVQNQIAESSNIDFATIFEPFKSQTNDDNANGHGLGLYIVSSLLERYNIKYDCHIDEKDQLFVFEINL